MNEVFSTPAEGEFDVECDVDLGKAKYTFSEAVQRKLELMGMSSPQRPRLAKIHESIFPDMQAGDFFDGRLPTLIRKLNLDQLSALNSLFSNWFAYLQAQTKLMSVQRSESKKKKEFVWSKVRARKIYDSEGRKLQDQGRSDAARFDIRFIEEDARYEELNALCECMEAMVDVCSQDMKVISREITMHQMDLEAQLNRGGPHGRHWSPRDAQVGNVNLGGDEQDAPNTPVPSKRPSNEVPGEQATRRYTVPSRIRS